eukprot:10562469-Karenia_brevis.AAC.1
MAQVKHALACNQILKVAQDTADKGLVDFDEAIMISVSGASWAKQNKVVDNKAFPRCSQVGRLNMIGSPELWDKEQEHYHLLGWRVDLLGELAVQLSRQRRKACVFHTRSVSFFVQH